MLNRVFAHLMPSTKPVITALSRNAVPNATGANVTLTGARFTGVTDVNLDAGAPSSFTPVSATQIDMTTGFLFTGLYLVTVTTPLGVSSGVPLLAYSLSVGTVTAGGSFDITGEGFTGTTGVTVNGAAASFTVNSDTSLTVTTAPGTSAGAGVDIVIYTPSAGTAGAFTLPAAIAVTSEWLPSSLGLTVIADYDARHVTTSGGKVTVAQDQSGNGRDATAPVGAGESGPIYEATRADYNGVAAMNFQATPTTADAQYLNIPAAVTAAIADGPVTIIFVGHIEVDNGSNQYLLMSKGTPLGFYGAGGVTFNLYQDAETPTTYENPKRPMFGIQTYGGAVNPSKTWINSRRPLRGTYAAQVSAAALGQAAAGGMILGNYTAPSSATYGWSGPVVRMIFLQGILTDAQAVAALVGLGLIYGRNFASDAELPIANLSLECRSEVVDLGGAVGADEIERLLDMSGAQRHLNETQTIPFANTPKYFASDAAFNNRPSFGTSEVADESRCLSLYDVVYTATMADADPVTVFFVLRVPPGGGGLAIYPLLNNSGSATGAPSFYGAPNAMQFADTLAIVSGVDLSDGDPHVVCLVKAPGAGNSLVFIDDMTTPVGNGSANGDAWTGILTGTYPGEPARLRQTALIAYAEACDATKRATVASYLARYIP